MDTLTHTLVGIAISRAGFKGKLPYATTALVIAANIPDIDLVAGWNGIGFLSMHRGMTHSLLAWVVFSVLIAWGLRRAAEYHYARQERKRRTAAAMAGPAAARGGHGAAGPMAEEPPGGPSVRNVRMEEVWLQAAEQGGTGGELPAARPPLPGWGICLALGFVGVGSHWLLDLTTIYGIRLLWPFSQHWFAADWMPSTDPWVWVILVLLLLAPMTLGLVGNEIGARRRPHRRSAIVALVVVAGWIGMRGFYHARVVRLLAETPVARQMPRQVGAFPYAGSPGRWHTVVEVKGRYQLGMVDATAANLLPPDLAPLPPQQLFTPVETPQIALAKSTAAAQTFLQFARFPFVYTQRRDDGGETVLITDLRFKTAHQPPEMGLVIEEGPKMNIESTQLLWHGAAQALEQ
ncbi:MAG: metal-dependent hydrolase [Terriglobales bacterium]